ncbi:MAG: SPFH domain-containing protein [Limisphaerales bacterium]
MKEKNLLIPVAGALLALIFLLILFLFQVRQTDVAVVTTFGKFDRSIMKPGLNFRWPWPVQTVYKLDNRLRNFERKFEQTQTVDGRPLLVTVFVGWKIKDPKLFIERFPGADPKQIDGTLEGLVRDAKNSMIGKYKFSELISTNRAEVKLPDYEQKMLAEIAPKAEENYGIQVELVGINRIGLPQSVTEKVFTRMQSERGRLIGEYDGQGDAEAKRIKAEADTKKEQILAKANERKTEILGAAEAEAAKYYAIFEQEPELATFLFDMRAFKAATARRTTFILDQQTPPFNRLSGEGATKSSLPTKMPKPRSTESRDSGSEGE